MSWSHRDLKIHYLSLQTLQTTKPHISLVHIGSYPHYLLRMHNYIRVVLSLCLIAVVKFSPGDVAAAGSSGSERDVASLMAFKDAVTQDPHGVLHSWNQSLQFCNWTGIRCNTEKWRVVRVDLRNMSLQGVLTPPAGKFVLPSLPPPSQQQNWGPHSLCFGAPAPPQLPLSSRKPAGRLCSSLSRKVPAFEAPPLIQKPPQWEPSVATG